MLKFITATLLLLLYVISAHAEEMLIKQNSISVMYGEDYRLTTESNRSILTFESLNITKANHIIFFNADIASYNNDNSSITTRLLGHYNLGYNVSLAGQLINQKNISSVDSGIAIKLPIGNLFIVDLFKHDDNFLGSGYKVFNYWSFNVPYVDNLLFSGFIEITSTNKTSKNIILAQPQIMYKVTNDFQVGMEYQVYINKNNSGIDENVPQLKLAKFF